MRTRISVVFALSIIVSSQHLEAISLSVLPPIDVLREAPIIAEAEVQYVVFAPKENLGVGYAYVTLRVLNVWRGECDHTIVLRRADVTADNYYSAEYIPTFNDGERVIVSLTIDHDGYYRVFGLYNGMFKIEQNMIRHSTIPADSLRHWINEIVLGLRTDLPSDFPDWYRSNTVAGQDLKGVSLAKNLGTAVTTHFGNSLLTGTGDHNLSGVKEFCVFCLTWNPNVFPLLFTYNTMNQYTSISGGSDTLSTAWMITLINEALEIWNDNTEGSYIEFELLTLADTTRYEIEDLNDYYYEDYRQDDENSIMWVDMDPGVWAVTYHDPLFYGENYPCINPPCMPGWRTLASSDILLNWGYKRYESGYNKFVFGIDPPSLPRTNTKTDIVETLAHELGHVLGIQHPVETNDYAKNAIMYPYYVSRENTPIREIEDYDLVANLHNHPNQTWTEYPGYTVILSDWWDQPSESSTYTFGDDIIVPSGGEFAIERGTTVNLSQYSLTAASGGIINLSITPIKQYMPSINPNPPSYTPPLPVFNPDIRLICDGSVKGLYSDVASALSDAASGDIIEVNSGVSTVSGTVNTGRTLVLNINLTVPSGTLTFANGSNLDLNGHYIKTTGNGTITNNGVNITSTPYATVKQGAAYKGFYSSVSTALENANPEETVYVFSSHTLSTNLVVPTGVTLRIEAGATINLNGKYIATQGTGAIVVDGTITNYNVTVKSGATTNGYFTTIQSAIDNTSYGQDVWVADGTYNENLVMEDGVDVKSVSGPIPTIEGDVEFDNVSCELRDFEVDGTIYVEDGYSVSLVGITSLVTIGETAVHVEYQDYIDVVDFASYSSTDVGIYIYGAEAWLEDLDIEQAETAVEEPWYAYVYLDDFYFCDNDLDIDKYYSSSIYIGEYNTFSDWLEYCTSGVRWNEEPDNYYNCYYAKRLGNDDRQAAAAESEALTEIETINEAYDLGMALLREIDKERLAALKADTDWNAQDYAGQYATAIALLKQALSESLDSNRAWTALSRIASSYGRLDQAGELYRYLVFLKEDAMYAELRPIIDNQFISYYVRQDDPATALAVANDLLETDLDDWDQAALLYRMGNIYRSSLDDPARAAACYRQVILDHPEDPASELAQARLEKMGEPIPMPAPKEAEPEITELTLSGYPNPFNPTTTVRFGLLEAGDVTLIVYDLMGRELIRLAEGYREAGWQEIVWNGRDASGREVPTGMYLARLVTPQGVKAIKLVMMK